MQMLINLVLILALPIYLSSDRPQSAILFAFPTQVETPPTSETAPIKWLRGKRPVQNPTNYLWPKDCKTPGYEWWLMW